MLIKYKDINPHAHSNKMQHKAEFKVTIPLEICMWDQEPQNSPVFSALLLLGMHQALGNDPGPILTKQYCLGR